MHMIALFNRRKATFICASSQRTQTHIQANIKTHIQAHIHTIIRKNGREGLVFQTSGNLYTFSSPHQGACSEVLPIPKHSKRTVYKQL